MPSYNNNNNNNNNCNHNSYRLSLLFMKNAITLLVVLPYIIDSVRSSTHQVLLAAGSNNDDAFRSSWSDEFSNTNHDEESENSAAADSRRPNSGPGSRDMKDVCSTRCVCRGARLELVRCENLDDFGTLQDEFACPNRIESLILVNITFKATQARQPVRLDANNFTDFRQLTTLRIINSSSVNIINYSAFLPSRNRLRHIEITNSRLQRIESGAFAYLDLDTLDVSNNRLYYHQKISPGTFQDARAIRSLILRNTSLSSLPTAVLAPIAASLSALDISYNRLHTLSSDLIPVFCQLGRLSMHNNTWCCAKPGRWLSLFLRLTMDQLPDKIVGEFPPSCDGGPRPLRGRPISDVSYEEMDKYETCEGLLGPRDPKTCQELLAKFHEMFAADHSAAATRYSPSVKDSFQQPQQQQQVPNATPARNDRFNSRLRTTQSSISANDNDQPMSSPINWPNEGRRQNRLTTSTSPPFHDSRFDSNYEEGEDDRNQLFIAGSKAQAANDDEDGQDGLSHSEHPVEEENDLNLESSSSSSSDYAASGRRRGALTSAASSTLSCGFIECSHIIYAIIGTVGLIALVGAGIGVYTVFIRRWRERSRHHLVERITS